MEQDKFKAKVIKILIKTMDQREHFSHSDESATSTSSTEHCNIFQPIVLVFLSVNPALIKFMSNERGQQSFSQKTLKH